MKILCISDQIDPLVYSTNIRERFGDVDLVLSAGDVPTEYLSFIVSCLNKPLLFVFGNHNLVDFELYRPKSGSSRLPALIPFSNAFERSCGATYIGSRVRTESGLIVAGLGGSIRYNDGLNQYTPFQMWLRAFALVPRLLWNRLVRGRYLDILLTHAPPQGINDREDACHRGFSAFLWIMRAFKPRFLVHGHVHLYDASEPRRSEYRSTVVVNVFSHYIIDTEVS